MIENILVFDLVVAIIIIRIFRSDCMGGRGKLNDVHHLLQETGRETAEEANLCDEKSNHTSHDTRNGSNRISIAIPITLPLEELDWGNDNEHIEGHKKAPRQHSNIQIVDRSNSTTAAERSCAVAIPLTYDAQTHYIAKKHQHIYKHINPHTTTP